MTGQSGNAAIRFYKITYEITERAHDPRCPRPLRILLAAWVAELNAVFAEATK